jgi:hypothetical protein
VMVGHGKAVWSRRDGDGVSTLARACDEALAPLISDETTQCALADKRWRQRAKISMANVTA